MKKIAIYSIVFAFSLFGSINKSTASNIDINDIPSYKKETLTNVVNELIVAFGNKKIPAPLIKMKTSKYYGAWQIKNEIGMEEAVYDICVSYQSDSLNCIAAIMGHELIHYYHHNLGNDNFIYSYEMGEGFDRQSTRDAIDTSKEAEADFLGFFMSYTAGYKPFNVLKNLLPDLYEVYSLPDQISGYPSLAQRLKDVERSEQKTKNLIDVFETANQLVAIEQYSEAARLYNFIIENHYHSREIYNNIGVCKAMSSFEYLSTAQLKFGYPIELDGEGRLLKNSKGSSKLDPKAKDLLESALNQFNIAFDLDPTYSPALLNKACVFSLLEKLDDATYFLEKAKSSAKNQNQAKTSIDCKVLEGILLAKRSKKKRARKCFKEAAKKGSILAAYNERKLLDKKIKPINTTTATITASTEKEQIDDWNINKIRNSKFKADHSIEVDGSSNIYKKYFKASELSVFYDNEKVLAFQSTNSSYKGTTIKGVKIGDSSKTVKERYGQPDRIISGVNSTSLVYDKLYLILSIKNDKVVGWSVFKK